MISVHKYCYQFIVKIVAILKTHLLVLVLALVLVLVLELVLDYICVGLRENN